VPLYAAIHPSGMSRERSWKRVFRSDQAAAFGGVLRDGGAHDSDRQLVAIGLSFAQHAERRARACGGRKRSRLFASGGKEAANRAKESFLARCRRRLRHGHDVDLAVAIPPIAAPEKKGSRSDADDRGRRALQARLIDDSSKFSRYRARAVPGRPEAVKIVESSRRS